jgi:hypothetical protein
MLLRLRKTVVVKGAFVAIQNGKIVIIALMDILITTAERIVVFVFTQRIMRSAMFVRVRGDG